MLATATAHGRFADLMLDSWTALLAALCGSIAVGRLLGRPRNATRQSFWSFVLALALFVMAAELIEPLAALAWQGRALHSVDDLLLLAAAPVGLWLASRMEPRPIAAQVWLVAGLASQVCAATLDLAGRGGVALALTPDRIERYDDFAQLLTLLSYLMAIWSFIDLRQRTRDVWNGAVARSPSYPAAPQPLRDTLYPPPFLFGLGLAEASSPAGRVHRLCNRALWPTGDVISAARNLGTILLWPVIASVRALKAVKRNGDAVWRLTGKSRLQQFLEQVTLAVAYRIAPPYYYVYEFYRLGRRQLARHYLMRYETKEMAYRLLYPVPTGQYEPTPLKNKVEFARHCRANGIRHVPILMLFDDGNRVCAADLADQLPAADLFVKRTLGKGGVGSELWCHVGDGSYRNTLGDRRDAVSLVAHVAELSLREPFFIQPAVRNHRDLADLSAGALSTMRLLSCRNPSGDFEVTNAAFRMSVDPVSPVDNFHAGGIAAAVDVATGQLGPATGLGHGPDFRWYDRHPRTGAQIVGRQLPMWREAVELAVQAHRAFHDYVLVGWDIAILQNGPCVIEGNRGPDVDILQRTSRGPIGNGRFGELLAYNLERRRGSGS